MKKAMYSMIFLGMALALAGCSTDTKTETTSEKITTSQTQQSKMKETQESTNESKGSNTEKKQYARGFEISLGEISKIPKGENHYILSIKVKIKNQSTEDKGIGSVDFTLVNKDKKIEPYVDGVNFGELVQQGKELDGIMTFEIPKELKKADLVYQQGDGEKVQWGIDF